MESGESNEENVSNDAADAKESEMQIEGIVQGEADNNVVQSAGQITNRNDVENHVISLFDFFFQSYFCFSEMHV